jgi:hypothetical protein
MEQHRQHPDGFARLPGSLGKGPRLGERGGEEILDPRIAEPRMAVSSDPAQISGPDRVGSPTRRNSQPATWQAAAVTAHL